MGGQPHTPKAPNYSGITSAAETNAKTASDVANQELAMQKQQYDYLKSLYNNDQPTIDKAVNNGLDIANLDKGWANTQEGAYASTVPDLQDFSKQALNWNSPENQELWAGRAGAAVASAEDAARENATRDLESYGINPASTRYASLDAGLQAKKGADVAAAENNARFGLAQTGMGYEAQAAGMGAQQASLATQNNANSNAASTAAGDLKLADTATAGSVLGTPTQYASLVPSNINASTGALGGATASQNTGFSNKQTQYQDQNTQSSGVGGLLGTVAGVAAKSFMPTAAAATGGVIPAFQPGGPVTPGMSPSAGAQTDDVTARLNAGEFVVPKDVLGWKGEEFFQKLIQGARQQRQQQTVARPQVGPAVQQGALPPR